MIRVRPLFSCVIIACFLFLSSQALAAGNKILDVQVVKSKGGIEAWLVEDHSVPVISLSFSFEGGLAYDPEDKPGVGNLVSTLLDEGAGDLKSQDFQTQLADNAISMGFTAGRDAFFGKVKTLRANKDLAFDLLGLALLKPRFDEDAITRMKNANISDIKDSLGDPAWLVARAFNGMLFDGHYYSKPGRGDLASMQDITREDLATFTKGQFAKNVLKVSIAGDISQDEVRQALDRIFAALPEKAAPANANEAVFQNGGKTILLPLDTPQTFITAGEAGIKRSDPAWHAAVIMNYILGGSDFDARLMKEIREKRGLTYGIYSSLTSMKHASLIQAGLSAGNEKAAEALKLLKLEWEKMAKNGPTEQEVRSAKDYLTGSLLLELTSTGEISDTLNGLQREDLGPNYINQRNAALEAVSVSDVKRAAAQILKPDALTVILVGRPQNINASILLDGPPGMKEPKGK
jgi:zinc protease